MKIHLIAVAVSICLVSLATVLAQNQTESNSTFNIDQALLSKLCHVESKSNNADQQLSQFSVRPLNLAVKLTWANKALFGRIDPEIYAYGYKPETIWATWKQNDYKPGLFKKFVELSTGADNEDGLSTVAIVEKEKGQSNWWKPNKLAEYDFVDSNYNNFSSLKWQDLNEDERKLFLTSNGLSPNTAEISDEILSTRRETFCTLQFISSQGGVIALPEKVFGYKPENTFVLNQK